jgi:hypothetical protein
MISYKIIVQNTADIKHPEARKVVAPGEPDFRETVFRRNLAQNRFKEGDRIKMRKTAKRGFIVEVIRDIKNVNWERNRPHFLVVQWDDKSTNMCIHTQLKPSKI